MSSSGTAIPEVLDQSVITEDTERYDVVVVGFGIAGGCAALDPQVRGAAVRWLSDGVYTLVVRPFPEYAVAPTGADRSALPQAGRSSPENRRATTSRCTARPGDSLMRGQPRW